MEPKLTHTVLLHGLDYGAYVTDENDDGTLELTAVPFYVKRAEPKSAEPVKAKS